jgi:hypothetical protein
MDTSPLTHEVENAGIGIERVAIANIMLSAPAA